MKIAVSSTGPGMDSEIDFRFGRCKYFVIVEVDKKEIKGNESIENGNKDQLGGAGITAAQSVADRGVNVVITGNLGPRAFTVFEQIGIEVYQGSGKVNQAVEKFLKGELEKLSGPTGPMNANKPGMGRGSGTGRGRI